MKFSNTVYNYNFTCNVTSNRSLLLRKFTNLNDSQISLIFTAGKNDKKTCENDEGSRNSGHLVGQKV